MDDVFGWVLSHQAIQDMCGGVKAVVVSEEKRERSQRTSDEQ